MFIQNLRLATTPRSTLGALYIDGEFQCLTLEDPFQIRKIPGISRIPEGLYRITLRTDGGWHDREKARYAGGRIMEHRGMLWVRDVPDFEWILIHPGNSPTDTEGCLLVGDNAARRTDGSHMLVYSRLSYERIYPRIAGELLAGRQVNIRFSSYA